MAEETGVDTEAEVQPESPHSQQPSGQGTDGHPLDEAETGVCVCVYAHNHTHITYHAHVSVLFPLVTVCFQNAARKEKAS